MVYGNTKVALLESVEAFRKSSYLAVFFSLFSSSTLLHLYVFLSVTLFMMKILQSQPSFLRCHPLRKLNKETCFDWSIGLSTGFFLSKKMHGLILFN